MMQVKAALRLLSASATAEMKMSALLKRPGASVLIPLLQEVNQGQDDDRRSAAAAFEILQGLVAQIDKDAASSRQASEASCTEASHATRPQASDAVREGER